MKKTCNKCKKEKSVDDFPRDKNRKGGRSGWCKDCKNAWTREYIKNNPEVNRRKARKWQKKQVELGNCTTCGKKAITKHYCEEHRKYHNKIRRKTK